MAVLSKLVGKATRDVLVSILQDPVLSSAVVYRRYQGTHYDAVMKKSVVAYEETPMRAIVSRTPLWTQTPPGASASLPAAEFEVIVLKEDVPAGFDRIGAVQDLVRIAGVDYAVTEVEPVLDVAYCLRVGRG